jgi:hypothetical protein
MMFLIFADMSFGDVLTSLFVLVVFVGLAVAAGIAISAGSGGKSNGKGGKSNGSPNKYEQSYGRGYDQALKDIKKGRRRGK